MQYYDKNIIQKLPQLVDYFKSGIEDENKNISHCILFWGADIQSQCELALEIARLLNCKESGSDDCECLNCRWIREQTHPAVKIYTRLDYKEASENISDEEGSSGGKKNINVAQARGIISELAVTSDYHRVYIFCDRDEDGNLLPLNKINFPEVTSNALLKTFEEPPQNTTFIFLTNDKSDVISTVVSRAQSFFVPSKIISEQNYELVENLLNNYWNIERNNVLGFENDLLNLVENNGAVEIFEQMENFMVFIMKNNFENKILFQRLLKDLEHVETAKRQATLTPPMNDATICENLAFKMILG
ncbi:hypothetical protein IJ674_08175 [bacterium]|nr:hypothetical protein [bacterium]